MSSDQWEIVAISASWAAGVGIVGLALAWAFRMKSLRWLPAGVAVVAVAAVVAGMIGASRAMFLSDHDYGVVLLVCLVAGIVAAIFSALVGTALVHWSGRLRDEARRFGESGRYDANVGGPAEFAALSQELRETSHRLEESRTRERRIEDSRRELISWVSHDLRTPLAGLRAMAEALEDGMVEDPGRYHRQIRTEVDRTVRMVDDLFELSRLHAGLVVPAVESVPLGRLVDSSLAGAESVAASRGVRIDGQVDEGIVVRADPDGLTRVLGNLLMNAIRHTPADGAVVVHGTADEEWVQLSVRDACGGIPEDELARVFDVSFRGEHARTPSTESGEGGAGLGLAIVRGIVEAHRGRVEVANEAGGCRFVVRLPA